MVWKALYQIHPGERMNFPPNPVRPARFFVLIILVPPGGYLNRLFCISDRVSRQRLASTALHAPRPLSRHRSHRRSLATNVSRTQGPEDQDEARNGQVRCEVRRNRAEDSRCALPEPKVCFERHAWPGIYYICGSIARVVKIVLYY